MHYPQVQTCIILNLTNDSFKKMNNISNTVFDEAQKRKTEIVEL
jgi:dihydropteroate synthase